MRTDPRVSVLERTNLRYLTLANVSDRARCQLATLDLSFISVLKARSSPGIFTAPRVVCRFNRSFCMGQHIASIRMTLFSKLHVCRLTAAGMHWLSGLILLCSGAASGVLRHDRGRCHDRAHQAAV